MTNRRFFMIAGSLLASALASAQTPPAPPAPLAPAEAPQAPIPPRPPVRIESPAAVEPMAPPAPPAPMAPFPHPAAVPVPRPPDVDFQFDHDFQYKFDLDNLNINIDEIKEKARQASEDAMEKFNRAAGEYNLAYGKALSAPFAFAPQQISAKRLYGMQEEDLYRRGQSALDSRRWEDAVMFFNQAAMTNGSKVEGALYWKAYALNQLGRGAEAKTVLTDLRAKHANSRWLDDAKALDIQIAQANGAPVSPDSQTDDDMKMLAINGIMQSDPERALPLLEGILKGASSPKVKQRALYVLAQSSSPKAQAILEQIARGGGNPDLQVKAILYMNERRRPNSGQLFSEIYSGTNDREVKRVILQALSSRNDKERLLAILKTEKDLELRRMGYGRLGENPGNPELWQLYEAETTSEGKKALLESMYRNTNVDKLVEVIRTEKDPEVRRTAIRVLGDQRNTPTADALVQLYSSESDAQIKRSILDSLSRNDMALVSLARAEKDPKLKLAIVERLSNMAGRSKVAADYLAEILK